MKKTILVILLGIVAIPAMSQLSEKGTGIVSFSVGRAIAGGVSVQDTLYDVNRDNGQVFSLAYDFMASDHFSGGFIVANHIIGLTLTAQDTMGNEYTAEKGKVNRFYAGFRMRWHYGRGDIVRFYSGFRIGMVNFSSFGILNNFPPDSHIEKDNNRSRYSLGITPIGMNIFLMDNFAAHMELNIGAPGFFFLGANYRF